MGGRISRGAQARARVMWPKPWSGGWYRLCGGPSPSGSSGLAADGPGPLGTTARVFRLSRIPVARPRRPMGEVLGGADPEEPRLQPEGIRFRGARVGDGIARALRKLHVNLGHPSARDLQRCIALAGAVVRPRKPRVG